MLVLLSVIPEPPLQYLVVVLVMRWLILPLLLVDDEPPPDEDDDELGPSTMDTAPEPPIPPTALLLSL